MDDDNLPPHLAYVTDVIRQRDAAEKQLAAIRQHLAYLVGYWGNSPSVSTSHLRELLEMATPPDQS